MKKILTLTLIGALFTILVASCGSSKGNCDAYGSVNTQESSDLASK
ncbi:MAG: hypothetical protein ACK5B9_00630 [Flavobacteriia bacterium]|jgi:hypothetical protein